MRKQRVLTGFSAQLTGYALLEGAGTRLSSKQGKDSGRVL